MKRISFLILALSITLTSGCPSPNQNNTNVGVNVNQNVNVNANNSVTVRDPNLKAVQLAVHRIGGAIQVAVAPKLLRVSKASHKLRFSAFNNLDQDISKIEVDFGSGTPFEGDFEIEGILSGEEDDTKHTRRVKSDATIGRRYDYTIRVFINGSSAPIVIDPQIEIGN